MKRRTAATRRAGFTLIEVLIAVAIITVLAGLLLVGVSSARKSAKRYQTISEITQLQTACENFKQTFKVFPPTPPNGFTIPTTVLSTDTSYQFLRRMYPNWIPLQSAGGAPAPDGTPISSTFDGTTPNPALINAGQTLDGNQALVYFLGGPTGTGWHPTKPYPPTGTSAKGPFYDFPQSRLRTFTNIWPSQQMPWFIDPYGSPYCYFVSPSTLPTTLRFPLLPTNGPAGGWISPEDTAGTPTHVTPFTKTVTSSAQPVPHNANGVQIVSAGPDQRFGPGGNYTPGQGAYMDDGSSPGSDDLGNIIRVGSLSNEQ